MDEIRFFERNARFCRNNPNAALKLHLFDKLYDLSYIYGKKPAKWPAFCWF